MRVSLYELIEESFVRQSVCVLYMLHMYIDASMCTNAALC